MDFEGGFFELSVHNHQLLSVIIVCCFFAFTFLRSWILPKIGRKYIYPKVVANNEVGKVVDMEGRIMSDIHAIVCVIVITYAFFSTPEYYKYHLLYHPTFSVSFIAAWDVGYMLYDFVYLTVHYKDQKNKLELVLMLVHHTISTIASSCVVYDDQVPLGCCILLMMETSTIFLNNIFFLNLMGLRDTLLFKINGLVIVITWAFFRFGVAIVYLGYVEYVNWERFKAVPFFFYLWWFTQTLFAVLNIWWFFVLIRGFLRILSGKKTALDQKQDKKE